MNVLKKHWTSFLGAIFIISSFIYLFKYTIDQGWVTDPVKIGIGLLIGAGFAVIGMKLGTSGSRRMIGEILTGLGVSLLYTTFSFAGIYYSLWDSMIVLLCMLAVTIGTTVYSYKFNLRILMNIALIGALVSPLIMRPETDQVYSLFLYLLVINVAYFYLSIRKSWTELRLVAFAGTWLMYIAYYIHFNPYADSIWSMPYRYAVAAFIFYLIALTISSWKNNLRFDGLNLYLGFVNAVLFGIWSVIILDGIVNYSYPLALMGLIYIVLGAMVYKLTADNKLPVLTKIFGGLFLILVSATQFGIHLESKPLIDVYVWLVIAFALLIAGQYKKMDFLKLSSLVIWFLVDATGM
jgi:uncharacterized membrane protein